MTLLHSVMAISALCRGGHLRPIEAVLFRMAILTGKTLAFCENCKTFHICTVKYRNTTGDSR